MSAAPTNLKVEIIFELLTDKDPAETTWSLIDNSLDTSAVVTWGPAGEDDVYKKSTVYNFAWILNRCTSYTFTIYDSYGDGLWSPVGYAKLMYGEIILGRIDGDFGGESTISFNICNDKDR
jgi:hypothetical protein